MVIPLEEWVWISGFEGRYMVSGTGRVKSFLAADTLILTPIKHSKGYLYVNIGGRPQYVHRLVAAAFLENPDSLPQVNHKDEDKTNNAVSNLEWCTAKYNMQHSAHARSGEKCATAKLNLRSAVAIRQLYSTGDYTHKDIAEIFGVSRATITLVVNNKLWREDGESLY